MNNLQTLLNQLRSKATSEREKGTLFEQLTLDYLQHEPFYRDYYAKVQTYADWAQEQHLDQRDTGIDLVAQTAITQEWHAIQCKFYAPQHRIQKADIDSFFTASGKNIFSYRLIVTTTDEWGEHAYKALQDQNPPVTKISLYDLEHSQIDWSQYEFNAKPVLKPKKRLKEHQENAVNAVLRGLATAERGKLIMACGTGKTFTSLKIAEQLAGAGGRVLLLVPSLALLSQIITEWTQESSIPLHSFAVCSDSEVGKKVNKNDDTMQYSTHELRYPATTNAQDLANAIAKSHDTRHLNVVFATYHSIEVISAAQNQYNLPAFNLIICDEAHRTTGSVVEGKAESHFVKVHDNNFIRAAKRLYMTATPRIYGNTAKAKADKDNVVLYSMDDATLYGDELYVMNFSKAVQLKLLIDYKVIVLAISEKYLSSSMQKSLADEDNQFKVDDATRIIGCWKALSKQDLTQDLADDTGPMQRAVAFCQVIEPNTIVGKVSSKQIKKMFQAVVKAYQVDNTEPQLEGLICEVEHVDGLMKAHEKQAQINWLKAEVPPNTCRILSNVRCLSEGVDVPALDAILFLSPRNSQVEVVQSVGRVMRIAPGKKRGYVILPVVIPAGIEPHEALDDNKTYKVVWEVLQALRSHDDSFDAMINKLDLLDTKPSKIEIIAIVDAIPQRAKANEKDAKIPGRGQFNLAKNASQDSSDKTGQLQLEISEFERAIYAQLVKKCGNRQHWEEWATDVGAIAKRHIQHIRAILADINNVEAIAAFNKFAQVLKTDLSVRVTDDEIIEMLAQHLITKPVFAALFGSYDFAAHNPVSKAMQWVLNVLARYGLDSDIESLQGFYASVKMRAEGINNAEGKQRIIIELYDKFFRTAFPRLTERLGIVYTPIEIVDFILHSVNHLLQQEFNETLGSHNVHILDPFTGTGTFITRLLQSGLINIAQLPYKYANELHANEIVLLAYYIAAINIESTYHDTLHSAREKVGMGVESQEWLDSSYPHPNPPPARGREYQPFPGICLTDTFALFERKDLISHLMDDNTARIQQQKQLDIRVIIGNPPYSVGQKSENDNNENLAYPQLDEQIRSTYAKRSTAKLAKGLYDSYIRAIRWASDRIKERGIIGFVTNAGFVDSNAADGLRQCLAEEFSSIYIFHLRGNARTSGELRRKEKDNVFGMGSRAPIAISLLIKNPQAPQHGKIYFYDIGDYLTREDKLGKLIALHSIAGITNWQTVIPDQHGDWLKQRQDDFADFIVLGDKKGNTLRLFENFSQGILTARDTWCYNASKKAVAANMQRMIAFYNSEVMRFANAFAQADKKTREAQVDGFVNTDPMQISWTVNLKQELLKNRPLAFVETTLIPSLYRPFTKQWLYFNRQLNERVYQIPRIFSNATVKNRVICMSNIGSKTGFSVLITNVIPDFQTQFNGQCFPLYLYDEKLIEVTDHLFDSNDLFGHDDLFSANDVVSVRKESKLVRKDGITDAGLAHFKAAYSEEKISKEDIFYYVYALLHCPDYRERYADNLSKELPRIPRVATAARFWELSQAGRALAELHINYETVAMYPAQINGKELNVVANSIKNYRVQKMRYGKIGKDKDLTTIH